MCHLVLDNDHLKDKNMFSGGRAKLNKLVF